MKLFPSPTICVYTCILFTRLTDHSSSKDNGYQALSKPSHALPPLLPTYYDTMNQNSSNDLLSAIRKGICDISIIMGMCLLEWVCVSEFVILARQWVLCVTMETHLKPII